MSTAESERLDLYNGLQEVLGTERATTLMTYLPSIESPDLLTRTEFKAEMAELSRRIDRMLLAMVAGLFVIVATVLTSAAVL